MSREDCPINLNGLFFFSKLHLNQNNLKVIKGRGTASKNASATPLIILDGVVFGGNLDTTK